MSLPVPNMKERSSHSLRKAMMAFVLLSRLPFSRSLLRVRSHNRPSPPWLHEPSLSFTGRILPIQAWLADGIIRTSQAPLKSLVKFPVIRADDTWGNWAVLSGMAAVAPWIAQTTAVGRLLGAPVTAMAMTFLLASIQVLPAGGTAAAKSLQLLSLQLATPLILLGADLQDAVQRCGPLFVSFIVASAATVTACLVGWKVAGSALCHALGGRDGLVLAAALMAKNIGGGINYIAVCRSLGASPVSVAAGLCIDNIFALLYFPVTSALASGLPDVAQKEKVPTETDPSSVSDNGDNHITVQSISTVFFLSAALLWLGERIGGVTGGLPITTLLTVVIARQAPTSWMEPLRPTAHALGLVCLYQFFATAGAPGMAVADSVRASLLPLSLYLICLYGIHGLILSGCHRLWGKKFAAFESQRLLVASSAAIGGPATAVALASAAKWRSLEVSSLLVGNVGYAIATFCGIGFYALFS